MLSLFNSVYFLQLFYHGIEIVFYLFVICLISGFSNITSVDISSIFNFILISFLFLDIMLVLSKIEMVRQIAEQKKNLELQPRQDIQKVFQGLEFRTQNCGTMIKNQKVLAVYLIHHCDLLIKTRKENLDLIEGQKAMRKSQKKIQVIWIIIFLTFKITLSAFLVGWPIYWMFN